jgi:hypothetical protein
MFDPKNSNSPQEKIKRISWTLMLWIFAIPLISMIFSLYASSFLEKHQSILIYPIQALILIALICINHWMVPKPLPQIIYIPPLKKTIMAIPMIILFGIAMIILGSELDNIFKHMQQNLQTLAEHSDPIEKVKLLIEAAWVALYEVVIWHLLMQRNLKAILPQGFDIYLLMLSAFLFYPIQQSHHILPTLYLSAWLYQQTNTFIFSWFTRFFIFACLCLVAYFDPMIPGFDDFNEEWQPIWFDVIGMIALVLAILFSQYFNQKVEDKEILSNEL